MKTAAKEKGYISDECSEDLREEIIDLLADIYAAQ